MSAKEISGLAKAVDQVLYKDWDPIGVSDLNGWPVDEYSSYAPHIAGLVRNGRGPEAIAEALCRIETERMGFETTEKTRARNLDVAEKLLTLKDTA